MTNDLLPSSALFRFSLPCQPHPKAGTPGLALDDSYILPSFAALDGAPPIVEVRAAWNATALHFVASVTGKKQSPWCRASMLDSSDGLRVWIDTRDTHNIHRASRFCHQFVFLPTGGGPRLDLPVAEQSLINRARENATPVREKTLRVANQKIAGGYQLEAIIPTSALTGFDAEEHPKLGFFWAVEDRELGAISLSLNSQFPIAEDPSLWATLELVK